MRLFDDQTGTVIAPPAGMNNSALQQMRILDIDQIELFEWTDSNRLDLSLNDLRFLRHPFLVTELAAAEYLLLDDTEYFLALVRAGLRHVPVQVYPGGRLQTFARRLGLLHFDAADLSRFAARQADRFYVTAAPDEAVTPSEYLTLSFRFAGETDVFAHVRHSSRSGCPAPIDALFRTILQHGQYFPLAGDTDGVSSIGGTNAYTGSMMLPAFSLDDLLTAASADRPFPPGIASVQARCRILNVDFPLAVLLADSDLEEKEAFLSDLIGLRARNRCISYHEGQVYLLNQ